MDKYDYLREARQKYPIGTKYLSAMSGDDYKINNDPFEFNGDNIYQDGYLYYDEKWATILQEPVIETTDYQIF